MIGLVILPFQISKPKLKRIRFDISEIQFHYMIIGTLTPKWINSPAAALERAQDDGSPLDQDDDSPNPHWRARLQQRQAH